MYRMIVDFRKANLQMAGSFQPLVDSQSIFNQIGEARGSFVTSFDMAVSFCQVPLAEERRPVTAFSAKSQHLQFIKIPMGLKSSPCAFHAALYDLFRAELKTNCSVYVDEGLIYHADFGQHLSFLRHIFAKLWAAKLRINPKKSSFARDRLVFLGFLLTPDKIQVNPERFQKIRDLQSPSSQKQTKILIGFLAHYRKFLKGFSALSAPLRMLLRTDAVFEWTEVHDQALQKIKDAPLENVVLLYPDMNKTFHIQTDASKMAVAHVLLQEHEGFLRPIAFGGRAFRQRESKLSAIDLELLAILDVLKAYHQFTSNGRRFFYKN
jgi:hypothetical protein